MFSKFPWVHIEGKSEENKSQPTVFHPLPCSSLLGLSKSTEPMIHYACVVFISSVGTLLFNKNMTHLTVAEAAHSRHSEQGEGRMYNPCWHTCSIYTQQQLGRFNCLRSQLQTLQMQVCTQPKLKQADPIFLAGKFCVTELPPWKKATSHS